MTKQEFADLIDVSRPTLNKWEKEKPYLIELINKGLQFDKLKKMNEEQAKKLKEIEEKTNTGKLELK
jgi:transcriptional regulator with XRE-family HTH domain